MQPEVEADLATQSDVEAKGMSPICIHDVVLGDLSLINRTEFSK
jgi:hypothetical protein